MRIYRDRAIAPQWIIMDVEGYEGEALQGARAVLDGPSPPGIVLEFHPHLWKSANWDPRAMSTAGRVPARSCAAHRPERPIDRAGCRPARARGRLNSASPIVSVVICCYNSAERLPQTLAHLANQVVTPETRWEVVIVDNASTDGTVAVANAWPTAARAPLRVVSEPRLGVGYARARGIEEARGEIISFVDDDNWLCPIWVQTVCDVMRSHPEVAALGGIIEPAFETARPDWFGPVAYLYATGPDGEPSGDVTGVHMLCGAGLSVRRAALADVRDKGFRPDRRWASGG